LTRSLAIVALSLASLTAYAADEPTTSAAVEQSAPVASAPMTGAVRTSLYADGDQTIVWRALAMISGGVGHWILSGSATADVVSSASIDVRSSPGLSKVDVTTSASGQTSTSGGRMSDRRLAATAGAGWNDGRGHTFNLSGAFANERDYNSVGAGWNGSIDLFQRVTTLLGGMSFTQNWIGSTLDSTFARQMYAFGWTAGVAQVLTRKDAMRLRYDGASATGYQASPYRNVRFGDWTTTADATGRITFGGTVGSTDGLAETEPNQRIRSTLTLEWVHSFLDGLALRSEARVGTDSWGVQSVSAGVELRAATLNWRLRGGYRFYAQSQADFYQPKYLLAASSYTYFTSDKELSHELGHIASLGVSRVLHHPSRPGAVPLLLDLTASMLYYDYPDFVLLKSRVSGFLELGITWEP
jgi:hypothetical protein